MVDEIPFHATRRDAMLSMAAITVSGRKEAPMTDEASNLAHVRAMNEAFNRHDIAGLLANRAEDALNHGRRVSREGIARIHEDIRTRFPDVRQEIQELAATGESVIMRSIYSGTHLGVGRLPVDGGQLIGVPPTGRRFAVQHIHWYKFRDGLLVEHRACRDDVGMLVQLGLLPAPPPFPG